MPDDANATLMQQVASAPRMVSWFQPVLLLQLLKKVIVADVFGQYADRRLIHAALDKETAEEQAKRASVVDDLVKDGDGAVWFDYVADLGDGFDATYAIALLLGADELTIAGVEKPLPRGGTLIMGGDEVYPTASRDDYTRRLLRPFRWARPDDSSGSHTPAFMIPGNHDWYDGLTNFLAIFCRTKETPIGGWRSRQRRSYFAVQLRDDWWIWGIDIALTADMDQPQADYFVEIARRMKVGSKIILCSAEPGWYNSKSESFRCLGYAAGIARTKDVAGPYADVDKEFKIAAVLSGDTHHYCRYTAPFGTEFVTSGGGGAFLHGTHQLKSNIEVNWLTDSASTLALSPNVYPSKITSRCLLFKNILFPFLNLQFSLFILGFSYWLLGYWLALGSYVQTSAIVFSIFAIVFTLYSLQQKENWWKSLLSGIAQGAVHYFWLSQLVGWSVDWLSPVLPPLASSWSWFLALAPGLLVGGTVGGGLIYGLNLLATSLCLDMNHNDAFSSLRLNTYRHFLRLSIKDDVLTIFPIGLRSVPKRGDWEENCARSKPGAPLIVPAQPLTPHLIERPIVIRTAAMPTVQQVVSQTWLAAQNPKTA